MDAYLRALLQALGASGTYARFRRGRFGNSSIRRVVPTRGRGSVGSRRVPPTRKGRRGAPGLRGCGAVVPQEPGNQRETRQRCWGPRNTYHQLGKVSPRTSGISQSAEQRYRKSLGIKEKIGDEHGAAITYHQLGMIAQGSATLRSAKRWYHKSLEITAKLGDEHEVASTQANWETWPRAERLRGGGALVSQEPEDHGEGSGTSTTPRARTTNWG